MKRTSTTLLKAVVVFIGIAVIAAMIRLPQIEGRAVNLNLAEIYSDPFIIYGYIASIPFFVGLFQVFKLLGLIEQNKIFSKSAVNAFHYIRNSALTLIAFIIGAAVFIRLNHAPDDDPTGFLALCILISVASAVVAAASSIFANLLQKRIKK